MIHGKGALNWDDPVQDQWYETTYSNDDNDGSENITKKMNLRPFKLYHFYLERLN